MIIEMNHFKLIWSWIIESQLSLNQLNEKNKNSSVRVRHPENWELWIVIPDVTTFNVLGKVHQCKITRTFFDPFKISNFAELSDELNLYMLHVCKI